MMYTTTTRVYVHLINTIDILIQFFNKYMYFYLEEYLIDPYFIIFVFHQWITTCQTSF